MNFLSGIFGYRGALRVKDGVSYIVVLSLGGLIILSLMAQFYLQVDVDPELREDVALQRTSSHPSTFTSNPKDLGGVAEAFLAFILMHFTKVKTMHIKKMHRIALFIKVLGVILFLFSLLVTFYEYLPNQ